MYKYNSLPVCQLPWEHLFFLQNLLNFIIAKYLKQVDDDLSACLDECCPCGLSIIGDTNLSMSLDQKVIMLLPLVEKFPVNVYHRVAFKPKFITVAPL